MKYVEYKPFGETKAEEGSIVVNKKFTGKELDDSTGLYDYGARHYNPQIRRFVSADTVDPDLTNPQTLNRYSYCLNNPLKYVDPSGNVATLAAALAIPGVREAVLIASYLIIKRTFEQLRNPVLAFPIIRLSFKLPGFSRQLKPRSPVFDSPAENSLKYEPEGMSYADLPDTSVKQTKTKTFRHYGYKKDAEKFEYGLRPGSFATEAKGKPMKGKTVYDKLGLKHHSEIPDAYYKVKVDLKETPIEGPERVPNVKNPGVQYRFPKGTPKGSVKGPYRIKE